MPTYRVLFVGLGKMGFHMAGFLSKQKKFIETELSNKKVRAKLFQKIEYF